MNIKRNKTLLSLMLGIMLLVSVSGLVSAVVDSEVPVCTLTIDKPVQGAWFDNDAIPVEWHLSEVCTPVNQFVIQYQTGGTCNPIGPWNNIISGLDSQTAQNPVFPNYHYIWDKPLASGQYCLTVKVTSATATGYSGVFNVDLAKPEVKLSVGTPKMGDCEDGTGTCYVSQDTEISLSCTDENPDEVWQSGVDYIEYKINDGEWTLYNNEPFNFEEDSNHLLQYRCFDKVGKHDDEEKNFVVETVAPTITRTITGPQVCPENGGDGCTKYFNLETEICISAVDPDPHPSDNVKITCDWWYGDVEGQLQGHHGTFTLEDEECFSYTEDSFHLLECTATDALDNSKKVQWLDVVDAKKPVTTLTYTGPHYTNGEAQWIDGVSTVVLTAEDQTPHPVEGVTTKYRYGVVDNSYCYGTAEGKTSLEGAWTVYTVPFVIPEESCHLIEYYSSDALANVESIKQEFVFVDKTAPELLKEVGKPSHDCNGVWEDVTGKCEEGWDWIVTMDTPIYLSCNDKEPHPSEVDKLCYKISWDGTVTQDWTCVDPEQFENEKVPIYFNEECVHTLEFYCVDNVGKTSETDVEVFKVEGTPFEIPLDKKWNLISFPFNLINSNVEEVFNDASEKIEGVWSYENGEWKVYTPEGPSDLVEVVPGRGYWVKTTEATSILVGGDLLNEGQMVPPSVELDKGWNLIGHYGLLAKKVYCSLFSLVDTQQGFPRWSALWGYDSGEFKSLNNLADSTSPGKGYWIEMDVEDEYSPATTCWGFT
jgi:hypothetical protein